MHLEWDLGLEILTGEGRDITLGKSHTVLQLIEPKIAKKLLKHGISIVTTSVTVEI